MSQENTVKIGLIGAGKIGSVHARHLRFCIPFAQLTVIADSNVALSDTLGTELGVRSVKDYRMILTDETIDAVVIASSTDTHAKFIEEAALAGKHIFCEKPIDHDLTKIDRALNAVKKAQVKLQIGFMRRFDVNFQHMKEVIKSGAIGKPHILKITSRDIERPPISYVKVSGGIFTDMMVHDFDMARYLIDSEVVSVFAAGKALVSEEIGQAGDVDTVIVTLEFENGAIGSIDNSREAVYGYDGRVEVFGSKGSIEVGNEVLNKTILSTVDGVKTAKPLQGYMNRYMKAYLAELTAFVDCLRNGDEPAITGDDGRAPMLIANACAKSLQERRMVALSELRVPIPH